MATKTTWQKPEGAYRWKKLEYSRIEESRAFKDKLLADALWFGTPQQQRLAKLELSRPWNYEVQDEIDFMNTDLIEWETPTSREWSRPTNLPIRVLQSGETLDNLKTFVMPSEEHIDTSEKTEYNSESEVA